MSVAIGLLSCIGRAPEGTCDGIDSAWMMGDILYAGPYHPVAPTGGNAYENFTVTVPSDFQPGPAVLAVAHFTLVGVSNCPDGDGTPSQELTFCASYQELFWPYLEVLNETVFIEN